MKNKIVIIMALLLILPQFLFAQEGDAEGCKDHPMFTRMPNFLIKECESKEFDALSFPVENSTEDECKKETIEGKYYYYNYSHNGEGSEPSELQIFRNFENALKQIDATIVAKVVEHLNSYSFITAKVSKNNIETWILIQASTPDYYVSIIEKQEMEQAIKANEMLDALNANGKIALNILFDTGKAVIKAESQSIIDQIYEMLQTDTSLHVSIEGHTDNVGNMADNKTLSQTRAKAVMESLIAKGIAKDRLSFQGWGQEVPVADNQTDEGKRKNRRVEIIKK